MELERINLVTEGTELEGSVCFDGFTRFHGHIRGNLKGQIGSELILGESGVVEGTVEGDTVIVDGFVRGNIRASSKVIISETGRMVGNIEAPNIAIRFGAFFEGKCLMNGVPVSQESVGQSDSTHPQDS